MNVIVPVCKAGALALWLKCALSAALRAAFHRVSSLTEVTSALGMASVIAPFFVFYCFPSANVVKKIVRTNTIVIVLVADLIKEFIYHYKYYF